MWYLSSNTVSGRKKKIQVNVNLGCAIAQAFSSRFPPKRPGFEFRSGHVGFVVDKVALGQVFS
jgi:hypothetical protein